MAYPMVVCMIFKMIVCHHRHHYNFHHYWWKASPASLSSILLCPIHFEDASIKFLYTNRLSLFYNNFYTVENWVRIMQIDFQNSTLIRGEYANSTFKNSKKKHDHPIHVIQCKAQNAYEVPGTPTKNYVNENQQQKQMEHQHQCPPTTAKCNDEQKYLSKDCDFKCKFAKRRGFVWNNERGEEEEGKRKELIEEKTNVEKRQIVSHANRWFCVNISIASFVYFIHSFYPSISLNRDYYLSDEFSLAEQQKMRIFSFTCHTSMSHTIYKEHIQFSGKTTAGVVQIATEQSE